MTKTDIPRGSKVVFPVTAGGLGQKNDRTIYREGTVISTWLDHGTERARIREDGGHHARRHRYVTRPVAVLVPSGSLAGQQRLAECAWNDRYAEWDRGGKPVHPWYPLVPGAVACWRCGYPKDSIYHQELQTQAEGGKPAHEHIRPCLHRRPDRNGGPPRQGGG